MKTDLEQTPQTNELRISAPRQCKAAVFERPNAGLVIRDIPIPTVLEPDAVLCRVRMSTLCGSDLHTVFGRRPEPAPSVLGHEIVGEIVEHRTEDLRDFNGVALSKGGPAVIATDLDPSRLQMARQFGADHCFAVEDYEPAELVRRIREACPDGRLSVAFEACGATEAADVAMEALDVAGRYLLAGPVTPNSLLRIDANQVIRKVLTIAGVHNYGPGHLQGALEFLQAHHTAYPFDAVVGRVFPLARINDAIQEAASGKYTRMGIRP